MSPPDQALTPAEAERATLARVSVLPAERRALLQATGHVLRQEVRAERDNPPFDRVCMDGVAISSAAGTRSTQGFRILGTQAAGAVPMQLADAGGAIEVMTGAVLPRGTDCVMALEEYALEGGTLRLHAGTPVEAWRNVQRRGSDSRAGEAMLHPGMVLGAAELAVVASAGLAEVLVSRQPRITVVSTGDELVEPGVPIAAHQVRRSNAYALRAALALHGYREVTDEHLRDDASQMRSRLGQCLDHSEVLILSGGVSKGRFDFVPSVLKALGVEQVFHQVQQRPGRPLWFGVAPRGQLVFGLPGNPVSTLVCLQRYVLPALRAATGRDTSGRECLALARPVDGRRITFYMPVVLMRDANGATVADPRPTRGSGDFLTLAGTAGFVELPPRPEGYPQGFVADFYRW